MRDEEDNTRLIRILEKLESHAYQVVARWGLERDHRFQILSGKDLLPSWAKHQHNRMN